MNLYHFYHVYADGDWKPIVDEHLRALRSSGLYDVLGAFNVGIVGQPAQRDAVRDMIERHCMRYSVVAEADEGWEQITVNALVRWSAEPTSKRNGVVLYAHTKGAAFPGKFPDRWRRAMTNRVVRDWRSITSAFFTGQWDTAGCFLIREPMYEPSVPVFAGVHGVSTVVERLTAAAQDAGVEYNYGGEIDEPVPVRERLHYSGNFWWATLDWICQLPYPCASETRWDAEMQIGRAKDGTLPRALDLQPGSPFDKLRS